MLGAGDVIVIDVGSRKPHSEDRVPPWVNRLGHSAASMVEGRVVFFGGMTLLPNRVRRGENFFI